MIAEKARSYQYQIDLLCSVPGIKNTAALAIVAEIGTDMSKFFSADHLCSWAGVCPQNFQSAGKKKPAPSKSGNSYLKSMLVQCANAAVKEEEPLLPKDFIQLKSVADTIRLL